MTSAPAWQLLRLADAVPAPWRNGGGSTRELLAGPDAGNWRWRLSVAQVAQAGPFSRYPGVQRWFAVLAGAGVRLRIDGGAHTLDTGSAPICFDGAAAVDCELVAGPTLDFNLMTRGGTARMERVVKRRSGTLRCGHLVAAYTHSRSARLLEVEGSTVLPPGTLAWRIVEAGASADSEVQLVAQDALWMEIAP